MSATEPESGMAMAGMSELCLWSADEEVIERTNAYFARISQKASDWLSYSAALDLIRSRLGAQSPGPENAALKRARNSGEVYYWPQKPPPLLKPEWTPKYVDDTFGRREETELYFRKDDLGAWLDQNYPVAQQKGRAGAKAKFDWDDINDFVVKTMNERDDFASPLHTDDGWKSLNDLYDLIITYVEKRHHVGAGNGPGLSTLKEKIPPMVARWRSSRKSISGHSRPFPADK